MQSNFQLHRNHTGNPAHLAVVGGRLHKQCDPLHHLYFRICADEICPCPLSGPVLWFHSNPYESRDGAKKYPNKHSRGLLVFLFELNLN